MSIPVLLLDMQFHFQSSLGINKFTFPINLLIRDYVGIDYLIVITFSTATTDHIFAFVKQFQNG